MRGLSSLLPCSLWLASSTLLAQAQNVVIPAPNGTYTVGRVTLQITNKDSLQPFAPGIEAPALQLSIFYPADANETENVAYMPTEVARYIDVELAHDYSIDSPNGTFERVEMQLAPNDSMIVESSTKWPLLVFGSALGTNRNFYNALVSQVASSGYVVITYDTPYDTDIVLYSNGSVAHLNETFWTALGTDAVFDLILEDINVRAQDTSYIIAQFSNTSFVSSIIPGCDSCLNTTHVGVLGHSLGGATAPLAMLNDTRIAGALDFDGTLFGNVVQEGLDKPFMLMVEEGNERAAFNESPGNSWAEIWPKLTASKFNLVVNNSRHYTFSDYPIVFDLLDILPTNETIRENVLLSTMNGTRALHIVTSYATAFFDWLLKDGSAELVATTSPLFPEVTLDTDTTPLNETMRGSRDSGRHA